LYLVDLAAQRVVLGVEGAGERIGCLLVFVVPTRLARRRAFTGMPTQPP